jgi:ribosome maturation factor RimP
MMDKELNILVNEILNGRNIHLIDVVIRGEKKNKIAEVYVDAEDVLDFDVLAEISRALNEKVDEKSFKDELLKMVVSSPGVERPFKYVWQLKKHINRIFEFTVEDAPKTGKLIDVDLDRNELKFNIIEKKKEVSEYINTFDKFVDLKVKLPF